MIAVPAQDAAIQLIVSYSTLPSHAADGDLSSGYSPTTRPEVGLDRLYDSRILTGLDCCDLQSPAFTRTRHTLQSLRAYGTFPSLVERL